MNKAHKITLALMVLMFAAAGLWKNGNLFSDENPVEGKELVNDRSALVEFWNHFNRASAFQIERDYEEAAVYYEKALKLNSEHEGALYNLGNVRLLLRQFEEAEKYWKKLTGVNPGSARGWLQLGTLYFCRDVENRQFNPGLAEEYYKKAGDLNREETGPTLQLSKIAILEARLSEAENYTNIVQAQNFASYQAIFLKGYLEWEKGNARAGKEKLDEAGRLYGTITEVTMAGEGATEAGFRPMLSEDMYCDFFGRYTEELLSDYYSFGPEQIYERFKSEIEEWRTQDESKNEIK